MNNTQQPTVITPINSPKGGGKKIILGVVAVLILLAGVGAAAFLTQQNQNIRSNAQEASSPTPAGAGAQCGSVVTSPDSAFSPFTRTENDFTTQTFNAPTQPNRQVIGVRAKFHDDTEEYEYLPTVTLSNGQSINTLDHTCNDRADGWVDVCTPNEDRIHSLMLENYEQTPNVSMTSITFRFRKYEPSEVLVFESLEWIYRDFCQSSPTPIASGQCGSLVTAPDTVFSPFTQTQNSFTTQTYNAPNQPNRQVVGVRAQFHDDTEEYEYLPTVTLSNGQTISVLDHTCNDRANGWVDVCTPNENRIHSLMLENYQQNPEISMTSISFQFREYESSEVLVFESLEWIYRDFCPSPTPSATPMVSAQCLTVAIYDQDWNRLTATDMESLVAGDIIRLAAQGNTNQGTIDKARFTINGVLQNETTTKRDVTNEFYMEYTLPSDTKDFAVGGQLHHSTLGWF